MDKSPAAGDTSPIGSYDLDQLGWLQFEQLCARVLERDAGIAQAIGDEYVSGRVPSDVGRPFEEVSRPSCAVPFHGTRRNVDVLSFSTEQHEDAALRIELDDHVGHLIHYPDVIVWIDADLGREHEAVGILADFTDELAARIKLE